MRCNNCGWENPDGNQKCEKCNAPLQGGATTPNVEPQGWATSIPQGGGAHIPNAGLHSTIRESAPFERQHNGTAIDEGTIIDKTVRDPHIDKTIRDPQPMNTPQPQPQPQYQSQPKQEEYGTGTVNPYANMGPGGYVPTAYCILKPVIFPGENPNHAPKPVNIKGDHNELNRQMLDPDNPTITSQVQAILTHKNGKWYIQNRSAHKTTFVFADEPIEVKTGDIILMGNRTFVFEED